MGDRLHYDRPDPGSPRIGQRERRRYLQPERRLMRPGQPSREARTRQADDPAPTDPAPTDPAGTDPAPTRDRPERDAER